jgi:EAL domain-containing protein (putative c-di-GMP-specific phosphodiesterase class I)
LRFLSELKCTAKIIVASGMDTRVLSSVMRLGEEHGLTMLGALQKPVDIDALEAMLLSTKSKIWHPTAYELERAIQLGEIDVYYQPKVELAGGKVGRISDCEALVRWRHPQEGIVGPFAFIPLAEESGLIEPLTDLVLEKAAAQIAQWNDAGLAMGVAVNLAASTLGNLDFPDRIASILAKNGVSHQSLTLEVTETTAMANATQSMDVLTRLRVKGLGLSIDDFGTGYSSFVQLYRMPFNELKIDKSFVLDVCDSAEAATIVRSIAELAHNLGLSVCAEGVETAGALEFLVELGCEKVQGYYIQMPSPADEFTEFVLDWNTRIEQKSPLPKMTV